MKCYYCGKEPHKDDAFVCDHCGQDICRKCVGKKEYAIPRCCLCKPCTFLQTPHWHLEMKVGVAVREKVDGVTRGVRGYIKVAEKKPWTRYSYIFMDFNRAFEQVHDPAIYQVVKCTDQKCWEDKHNIIWT